MANISDVRSIGTPQRAYEFEVKITGAHGIELMTKRVQAVTIPEVSHDQIEINFKSSKSMWAGRDASPHLVTVSFFDDESQTTYSTFREWAADIRDPAFGGGVNTGTSRALYGGATLEVVMLAHDSTSVTKSYLFTNVWPQSVGEVSLSYENSEHMKFDVTFSYDEQISGQGGSSGSLSNILVNAGRRL